MTCDGKTMAVTGAIEYSITDLGMAAFKVENFDEQLANAAKAIINSALNCRTVKEVATQGDEIEEDILMLLGEEAEQWGLTVSEFRIVQKCPIRPILLMNVE
jgi:regulator of protease activity HflC (stomatin/prohibitin superfamily)